MVVQVAAAAQAVRGPVPGQQVPTAAQLACLYHAIESCLNRYAELLCSSVVLVAVAVAAVLAAQVLAAAEAEVVVAAVSYGSPRAPSIGAAAPLRLPAFRLSAEQAGMAPTRRVVAALVVVAAAVVVAVVAGSISSTGN
jgi:hypothetical protein